MSTEKFTRWGRYLGYMADPVPTSAEVGQPVTVVSDGTIDAATAVPVVTSATAQMDVKYVPTPGAADDV